MRKWFSARFEPLEIFVFRSVSAEKRAEVYTSFKFCMTLCLLARWFSAYS